MGALFFALSLQVLRRSDLITTFAEVKPRSPLFHCLNAISATDYTNLTRPERGAIDIAPRSSFLMVVKLPLAEESNGAVVDVCEE